MRRKIFTVILAVMIITTFMPAASFGISSVGSPGSGNISVKLVFPDGAGKRICSRHSGIRSRILHNEDMLEVIQQALMEAKIEVMDELEGEQDHYAPEVWNTMMAISAEFDKMVNSAESYTDLGDEYMGMIFVKEEFAALLNEIESLKGLTIQKVTSAKDLTRLKTQMKKGVAENFAAYQKADYTDYYWGIVLTKKAEINRDIDAVKTFRAYGKVYASLVEDGFLYPDEGGLEEDMEFFSHVIKENEDLEGMDYYVSSWVFTKDEVSTNRAMFQKWADDVIKVDMKALGYKNASKDLAAQLKQTKAKIKSEVDCDVMYRDYLEFEDAAYKKAEKAVGLKEPASIGDIIRLQKKMTDIFYQYKEVNYSTEGWSNLNEVYTKYYYKTEEFLFQSQINDQFLKEMKTALNKVPNLKAEQRIAKEKERLAKEKQKKLKEKQKKELKKLKKKRIKQIRKYAKNKKFDQKKSLPLAKKAVKKIKAAKTKAKVNKVYKKYKAKIKKTAVKKEEKKDQKQ